jgi:hypothetical protein
VALAWPLGGAWVAQGWPNPKPNPNPKQAEGRKVKARCFAPHAVAFSGQKLRANSQKPNCQISFLAHTLRRCRTIAPFVRLFKREVGHVPHKAALRNNPLFGHVPQREQCVKMGPSLSPCLRVGKRTPDPVRQIGRINIKSERPSPQRSFHRSKTKLVYSY